MSPKRIQRRRTKGWRMPKGAVYVGRPTRWGNPWAVGDDVVVRAMGEQLGPVAGQFDPGDRRFYDATIGPSRLTAELAVFLYRDDLASTVTGPDPHYDDLRQALAELRGHDLVCWCPLDQPCHADVLLEMANA